MSEMLMTEANQTNEGDTQQPVDASTEATTETQQHAESVQDQQVSDETAVESETSDQEAPKGAPTDKAFKQAKKTSREEMAKKLYG